MYRCGTHWSSLCTGVVNTGEVYVQMWWTLERSMYRCGKHWRGLCTDVVHTGEDYVQMWYTLERTMYRCGTHRRGICTDVVHTGVGVYTIIYSYRQMLVGYCVCVCTQIHRTGTRRMQCMHSSTVKPC